MVLQIYFLSAEEQIEKRNRILQEADIEEEKRDVIHREIGKFREIMKVSTYIKHNVIFAHYYVILYAVHTTLCHTHKNQCCLK